MGILSAWNTELLPPKTESRGSITHKQGLDCGMVAGPTRSGISVSETTATGISTFYRAARVISESVANLPLKLYRRTEDGREEARDHTLYDIIHSEANPDMGADEFRELLQWWAVVHGNAYAEVQRKNNGQAVHLHPIPPWTIRPGRVSGTYEHFNADTGGTVVFDSTDILHIRGPSPDGSEGYRLARLARESLGYTIALERFGASYFANSTRVGGIIEAAGTLNDQARVNLRNSWSQSYAGPDNVGKVPVLEEGMKFVPFQVSNNEAQYLEARQFQVNEICRWVGVDPIFIYEYGRATWSNAEAQTRNYLTFSLNRWLGRWESQIARKCLSKADRTNYYPEFTRAAIVQMDAKTQAEVRKIGVDGGWLLPDEIRKQDNLPPLPPKPVVQPVADQPNQEEPDEP